MKNVNYFGTNYTVPDYAKFIATDAGGEMWWYIERPACIMLSFSSRSNCGRCGNNSNVKYWRRSLREC